MLIDGLLTLIRSLGIRSPPSPSSYSTSLAPFPKSVVPLVARAGELLRATLEVRRKAVETPELRDLVRALVSLETGDCEIRCWLPDIPLVDRPLGDPLATAVPLVGFPFGSERDGVINADGEDATAFPPPKAFLPTDCFCAARVCLLSEGGCNSRGSALTLEDLRLPS